MYISCVYLDWWCAGNSLDDHILCHELGGGFYTLYKYDLKHQVRGFLVRSNTSDHRLFMSDNRLFTSRIRALSTAIQDLIRFLMFSRTGKWPDSWSQLQERLLLLCRIELSLFSSLHLPMPQLIRELSTRLLLVIQAVSTHFNQSVKRWHLTIESSNYNCTQIKSLLAYQQQSIVITIILWTLSHLNSYR